MVAMQDERNAPALETGFFNNPSLFGVDRHRPFFMNFPPFCNAREMRGRYNPRR